MPSKSMKEIKTKVFIGRCQIYGLGFVGLIIGVLISYYISH